MHAGLYPECARCAPDAPDSVRQLQRTLLFPPRLSRLPPWYSLAMRSSMRSSQPSFPLASFLSSDLCIHANSANPRSASRTSRSSSNTYSVMTPPLTSCTPRLCDEQVLLSCSLRWLYHRANHRFRGQGRPPPFFPVFSWLHLGIAAIAAANYSWVRLGEDRLALYLSRS